MRVRPSAACIAKIRPRAFWSPAVTRSALRKNWPRCRASSGWSATRTRRRSRICWPATERGRPYHGQILTGDIFETRDILTAPILDADRRPHAPQPQDSGWLPQPLLLLHHSFRARQEPLCRRGSCRRHRCARSPRNTRKWCSPASIWAAGAGKPAARCGFADLLRRLLDETDIERIRLSSVEPMDFSDDLLGLMAETPRISKHVHAPLQSGSDTILRRMHRKYRPRHYADRVHEGPAA